jgi:homocysteine S-methyltransferase
LEDKQQVICVQAVPETWRLEENVRHLAFADFLERAPCILGEGAVIERLRRNSHLKLDPHILNSGYIYEKANHAVLEAIYRQYLDIGFQFGLPLLLLTPTWRANRERIAAAGLAERDVNGDNFRFLDSLRASYGEYSRKVAICGMLSCRGDAYRPDEALPSAEAREFHAWQAAALAKAGVDCLLAVTLPALSEAIGLASALAATGRPYLLSFVVRPEGTLLDSTPIRDAVIAIDESTNPKPLAYLVNCTHASVFRAALCNETNTSPLAKRRIVGLLANTAALHPEELDNSACLVEEEPGIFGRSVAGLHRELGMKILGGCCGTDNRHIHCLAKRLSSSIATRKKNDILDFNANQS